VIFRLALLLFLSLTSYASLSHQQALSYLTGGLAGLVVDGAEGADTGARVALSAEIYNRQLHHKEIEWLKDRENIEAFRRYYREYTGKEIGFDEAASLLAKGGVSLVDGGWNERFGSDPAVKEAMDFIKERYEGESLLWYAEPDGTLRSTKAFAPSLEEYGDRYGALVEFAKNKEFYETHLDLSTPSMGDPAGYMEGIASPVVTLFRSVQTDPWGTLESVGESVLHPIDSLYAAGMQLRTSYEKGRLDSLMGEDYAMSRHYGETLSGAVWALVGKATGSVVKAGSRYFTKLQNGSWVEVPRDAVVKGKDGKLSIDKSWKKKIYGTAQKTGTPGHAFRAYRIAIQKAKDPNVKEVHLDHGYNRALGLPPKTVQPNRRPDVTAVHKDGTVERFEVKSKTDVEEKLKRRNDLLDPQLIREGYKPEPTQVEVPTTKGEKR